MAIKISNVSVIDNDRNVINANTITFTGNTSFNLPAGGTASRPGSPENGMIRYNTDEGSFEGYAAGEWGAIGAGGTFIKTPTNTYPANGETNVSINPTLQATSIQHIYNLGKTSGTWQISVTSTFANTELNATISSSANSYATSANLQYASTYYWRVKYADGDGNESEFSTPAQFTTQPTPPTTLGQSYGGGYYIGLTCNCDASSYYYLVVAPISTGQAKCAWQTSVGTVSGYNGCDGYLATYEAPGRLTTASNPAGNFTATRTIGGYCDWYLPSTQEMFTTILNNRGSLPVGEQYNNNISDDGGAANKYWTSTQNATNPSNNAWLLQMYNNEGRDLYKLTGYQARAVRRDPV